MVEIKLSARIKRTLYQRHPSAFLLAAQALLLIFFAVFDEVHIGRAFISALGVVVLILAVWVVTRSPAVNWIAWVLAVPAFIWSCKFGCPAALSANSTRINPVLSWSSYC